MSKKLESTECMEILATERAGTIILTGRNQNNEKL